MSEREMAVADVNALTREVFVSEFGGIAEHSAWVAESAEISRPYASREAMIEAFSLSVTAAPEAQQLALLKAHPDLAGRAAISGEIGDASRSEQAGAGLDTLTAEEFDRFTKLNTTYRKRFDFPFILAVRGATKHDILTSFDARIGNSRDHEFETAIAQVRKIIRFRLEDRITQEQ